MRLHTSPALARTSFRNARRAFTLLEILVVLAIIGMLVGLAVTNLGQAFDNGKKSTAKIFVTASVKTALGLYRIDMLNYPSTADTLQALASPPANAANWRGPYIESASQLMDPWGKPYQYAYPGTHTWGSTTQTNSATVDYTTTTTNTMIHYDVWSMGPDGVDGTADDIGNWQQ